MPGTPERNDKPKPRTALGFDFGVKHIGVAIGQTVTGTARALKIFRARDGQPDWPELLDFIDQWQADVLIVGLPSTLMALKVSFAVERESLPDVYESAVESRFKCLTNGCRRAPPGWKPGHPA